MLSFLDDHYSIWVVSLLLPLFFWIFPQDSSQCNPLRIQVRCQSSGSKPIMAPHLRVKSKPSNGESCHIWSVTFLVSSPLMPSLSRSRLIWVSWDFYTAALCRVLLSDTQLPCLLLTPPSCFFTKATFSMGLLWPLNPNCGKNKTKPCSRIPELIIWHNIHGLPPLTDVPENVNFKRADTFLLRSRVYPVFQIVPGQKKALMKWLIK